jgi:hypothetical protein
MRGVTYMGNAALYGSVSQFVPCRRSSVVCSMSLNIQVETEQKVKGHPYNIELPRFAFSSGTATECSTAHPSLLFVRFDFLFFDMALEADTVQTLAFLWVFTWLAMFLMGLRIFMRRYRNQKLDVGDKITIICMICMIVRLAFIHVVLVWGTNNIPPNERPKIDFTLMEIYRRRVGSKLLLTSRTWYNT